MVKTANVPSGEKQDRNPCVLGEWINGFVCDEF